MILAYLRERMPVSFYGPLAFALAGCALGAAAHPATVAATTLAAFLLVAQFRIWDDLADRRQDAAAHPDRVLARTETHGSLVTLAVALFVANVTIAAHGEASSARVVVLAVLHAALGCYYLCRRRRTVLGDQVVLAKYPAFVLVVAGERLISSPVQLALTAALVYVAASAYEAWHDPVSPLAQLLGGRS